MIHANLVICCQEIRQHNPKESKEYIYEEELTYIHM